MGPRTLPLGLTEAGPEAVPPSRCASLRSRFGLLRHITTRHEERRTGPTPRGRRTHTNVEASGSPGVDPRTPKSS